MDTRRPSGADGAGEASDDLITELARLVGQDARSGAAERTDPPPLDRGPARSESPQAPSAPVNTSQRTEPQFSREPSAEAKRELEGFDFDFGFGQSGRAETSQDRTARSEPPVANTPTRPAPAPQAPTPRAGDDDDPIAALIADADQESLRAEEERWQDDAAAADEREEFAAGTQPVAPPEARTPQPRPEPSAASAREIRERDPLSEIEALIGEAARVNVEPGPMGARRVRSVYAPAEPPVAPEAKPESLEPSYAEDGLSPAERAIMAATVAAAPRAGTPARAETRADDRVEPQMADHRAETTGAYGDADEADPEAYDDLAEEDTFVQRRRSRRLGGMIVPAAVGSLVLAGLFGGYVVLSSFGGGESGDAPVLVADGEPAKVEPEPTNTTGTTGDSIVFSDIEGQTADPEDSTLVSRDETDGASGSAVSSLLATAPEEGESALANRSVRTVTVRPDGTIVTGDSEGAAGSSILPVDRPDVPAIPQGTTSNDPIGATIAEALGETGTGTEATLPAAGDIETVAEAETDVAPLSEVESTASVPLPLARPGDLASVTAPADETVASAEPADDVAGVEGPVGAWVQLSSQRSEAAAQAGVPELERRYGVLFNGTPLDVSPVDLGENGTYYRVRLPQPTMADATAVCDTIRAAEGDCFVMSN